MKPSYISSAVLALALAIATSAAAQSPTPKPDAGKPRPLPIKTKVGTFELGIETDFLGMAGKKTVVRIRLTAPELSREAVARGIKGFAGQVKGGFRQADETEVDSFQYPVTAEISSTEPFAYSFLRAVPPGSYRLRLV